MHPAGIRNLKYMRKFTETWRDSPFVQQVAAQISSYVAKVVYHDNEANTVGNESGQYNTIARFICRGMA